ncbi:hypothetical protein H4217_000825 [Coemansia sp. RSA 1939]|nr:hypothetical protein H4217_000825 [Coemansia sp. RSA 1939]KAJ2616971.1 hypothetical protein EV177_000804 [Coemansia sp. RSA 1804]KAJ2695106.1 hypothetical protein GGH99_000328 [Coemansia sp. RSA 1285]
MKSRKGPERNKPSAPASQGETRQAALEKYRMWLDESSSSTSSSNGDSDGNGNGHSSSDESELKEPSAESNGSVNDVANIGTFGSGVQPETRPTPPTTQQPRLQQAVLQEDDDDVVHPVSPSHPPTYRTRSVTGIGRPAEDRHRPRRDDGNQQHQRQKQKQPGNASGGNVGRERAAQSSTTDANRPALASAVAPAERQSPATRILHTPRKLMRQMLSPSPSPSPFPSSPSLYGASRPARQNTNQTQSPSQSLSLSLSQARHHRKSRSHTSNMTRVAEPAGLYSGRADELDARGMGSLFGDAWIARPQTATTRQGTREEGADDQQRVPHAAPIYSIPSRGSTLYDVSLENGNDDRKQQYKEGLEGRSGIRRASTGADVWEYYRADSMQAWRVAVCALLATLVSLSTVLSYCVYQEYYLAANAETATLRQNEGLRMPPSQGGAAAADGSVLVGVHAGARDLLATGRAPSRHVVVLAALVGALMCTSAAAFALPAALAAETVGMRAPASAGTVLMAVGLFSASFIPRLQGLCAMQGVVCGAGVAFVLVPAYSAAPMWFDKHRALASGVAVAGAGAGLVALTPVYVALMRTHGMAASLQAQALVVLVLGVCASLGLRPRVKAGGAATRARTAAVAAARCWRHRLADARMWALMALVALATAARFAQLLCLPAFARANGVALAEASRVLYAVGASLVVGAVGGGWIADRTGCVAGLGLSEVAVGAVTLVLWVPTVSPAPLYVYAALFGLGSGGLAALLPPAAAQMFGVPRLASTIALAVTVAATPAILLSFPAAVRFLDLADHRRSTAWLVAISGILSLLAGIAGLSLPLLERRHRRIVVQRETSAL